MPSVEKLVKNDEVEKMIGDMARRWKAHRTKRESLSKAFEFILSEDYKSLPVEVRVLVLKGAFYVNRTLPKTEGGELE